MSHLVTRSFTVRFTTPAFLGNAEQRGQWRTPPFKALLRQWWRIAVAKTCNYDFTALRRREDALFGTVEGRAHKSMIRMRLSGWDAGKATPANWPLDKTTLHPEVSRPVGAHLYLGYGPLTFSKGKGTTLKKEAAIQADEEAKLSLAFPEEHAESVNLTLWLIHQYGTVGGRSRNGWGSLVITPVDGIPLYPAEPGTQFLRDWHDALALDWAHAVGTNDGEPLVWRTADGPDWEAVMTELAKLKIGLRTQFKFHSGKGARGPEPRHWLSYPVTNHNVTPWDRTHARLPNSLRFKVRRSQNGNVFGVIFHIPCLPPPSFHPERRAIEAVWTQVHAFLEDPAQELMRLPT
ncbi:MAG TPA: RAMP superfamily CRISPR-associated protein [Nevskiaceae bacterium]